MGGLLAVACGDSSADGDGTADPTASTTTSTTDPPATTAVATSTGPEATSADTTEGPATTDSSTGEDSTGELEPPEGSFWVFVTANQRVTTFSMDPATGDLTFDSEVVIGSNVGPLAVRPALDALYVGVTGEQRAQAYSIDPVTAQLAPIGQIDLGWNPVYLATDLTGTSLLGSTFGGDELAIFPLGADGSLGGAETQRLATPEEPHAILTDPSNGWVFVPHRTPDVVGQYAFDAATGTVSPNAVPQVASMPNAGPRHLVFHPDGDYAYLADEFSDSVTTFSFDVGTGQLTLLETLSTLPPEFPGNENTCADVHITPDGRFVYVSNRGHDSLAMFSVDPATGLLTALGQVPTEARPREFEVSPRGRYVYAAGQDSGMLASYSVDDASGMLTAGPVYDVGDNPLWVLAIELPAR